MPIAVDTNVLVRFLTNDEPRQAERARRLLRDNEILLAPTVLLETEWVLRFSYNFSAQAIHTAFEALLGLPNLETLHSHEVDRALHWYAGGMDFADALHLALVSPACFRTFDGKLIKKANRLAPSQDVARP